MALGAVGWGLLEARGLRGIVGVGQAAARTVGLQADANWAAAECQAAARAVEQPADAHWAAKWAEAAPKEWVAKTGWARAETEAVPTRSGARSPPP